MRYLCLFTFVALSWSCSNTPEGALLEVSRSLGSDAILRLEELVDLDSLASSIAAATHPDSVASVAEALRNGLDRARLPGFALADVLQAAGVYYEPDLVRANGERAFRSLGPVQRGDNRALVPIFISHPFIESDSVELGLELVKNEREWRLIRVRALGALVDALRAPSPRDVLTSDIRNLASLEEIFFSDTYRYSADVREIGFAASPNVAVRLTADPEGMWWSAAVDWLPDRRHSCAIYYGGVRSGTPVLATATMAGAIPRQSGEIFCDLGREEAFYYLRP